MTTTGVTFYFMRHAETLFNRMERIQGWANAPLTEKGIAETHRSANGLAEIEFDAIYSSDLQRAIETAEIVKSNNHYSTNVPIQIMKEFREVNFGYYEGLDVNLLWKDVENHILLNYPEQAAFDYTQQMELFLNTLHELDPYKIAENYTTFWMRIESGLLELLNRHAGTNETILVVSHGLAIKNLLHGLIANFNETDRLLNASICKVQYRDGQFQLLTYNDCSHFSE